MKAKTVKFVFLALAVCLTLVMFLWPAQREERLSLSTAMEVPEGAKRLSSTDVEGVTSTVMEKPHFTGEDENGKRWSLKALNAVQQMNDASETMVLNELEGSSTLKDGQEISFVAGMGYFEDDQGRLTLKDDVRIQGMGYTLKSDELSGRIQSFDMYSDQKVYLTSPKGLLEAGAFHMQKAGEKITFSKGVSVRFVHLDKAKGEQLTPFNVTAESLEAKQPLRYATFSGNVKVDYGVANLGAQLLKVYYQPEASNQGDISKVEAVGDVIITDDANTASGEKAVYTPKDNEILLSGNVVMTKNGNTIQGESLTYNLDTGNMRLHNTEEGSTSDLENGRVKAKFTIKGKN